MNYKKIIWVVLLIGMTTSAGIILGYYWMVTGLQDITVLPFSILGLALVYIGLQLIKRALLKIQNWWDWTYYLGLVSIVVPVLFAKETNQLFFHLLTDYGTMFLMLPVVMDIRKLFFKK